MAFFWTTTVFFDDVIQPPWLAAVGRIKNWNPNRRGMSDNNNKHWWESYVETREKETSFFSFEKLSLFFIFFRWTSGSLGDQQFSWLSFQHHATWLVVLLSCEELGRERWIELIENAVKSYAHSFSGNLRIFQFILRRYGSCIVIFLRACSICNSRTKKRKYDSGTVYIIVLKPYVVMKKLWTVLI